jgi:8-oxo-dGTP pyrophosphatase MutT (NUDIX family)
MKTKPTFNNIENKVYNIDNKEIWLSRSCAVIGVVFATFGHDLFVLAEKRSAIMEAGGLWAVPGGYMDWNESGWDAIRREIYEETNFFIDDYKDYLEDNNYEQPIFVKTEPDENRQNISLRYGIFIEYNSTQLPHLSLDHNEVEGEVEKAWWMPISDINNYEWAFSHNQVIFDYLNLIIK